MNNEKQQNARIDAGETINDLQNTRMDRLEDKLDHLLYLLLGNLAAALITLVAIMIRIRT